ncbi:MAG: ABC transporter ATP-binding protein [Bacteroidales bacterium]|nr:ABC transporter ATP-binding protein [Bacteroidales bacterium]
MKKPKDKKAAKPSVFSLLKPYKGMITMLILFALTSNMVNLLIPQMIAGGIDDYSNGHFVLKTLVINFGIAALVIFIFTYLQSIVQTIASERVAKSLRTQLSAKISRQSFAYIQDVSPSKLLTNLTSDIDSIKMFVAQAVVSIVSSIFVIIGACILLFITDWQLALPVIMIIPIIGGAFYFIFRNVRPLFKKSREVIDWLNKVINESILGASIIRVLNSQQMEYNKFLDANTNAKSLGLSILRLFATLIPIINFTANMAILTILALGGHFVITGDMTLGSLAAFNSYIVILIFPIIIIGFMSNIIAQASASYSRISEVLNAPETETIGTIKEILKGAIELNDINVSYDGKPALKNISLSIQAGSQLAIIGPTAAGKSQLLYLITGLIKPDSGTIKFDGQDLNNYDKESLHGQIGLVFQDSIIFNMSLRENIAFSNTVTDESLEKAIETAGLREFIDSLPEKLDTIASERGLSLSGGQKQRIMLARALALAPKILLLDDFTARVDKKTEQTILANLKKNYPDLTLISVTQQITPIKEFDQIILLMEGELVASGKHKELKETCPEYAQINNSQRSTSYYELQS